jgi:CRP-like cAMP-binding protein
MGLRVKDSIMSLTSPIKISPELLRALHQIKLVRALPKGATLFRQGSVGTGVYLVLSGEIRILLPTSQHERQLLEVMGPGALLGLSESLTGQKYRVTGEAAEDTIVGFIPGEQFLQLLQNHCDFCTQIARNLSEELHGIYHKFRSITAHPGRPRHRPLNEQLN